RCPNQSVSHIRHTLCEFAQEDSPLLAQNPVSFLKRLPFAKSSDWHRVCDKWRGTETLFERGIAMITTQKPILELTAADLMTRDLVCLPHEMSMKEAARLLLQNHISGAPVVDNDGQCIGVISATDFVTLTKQIGDKGRPCVGSTEWEV